MSKSPKIKIDKKLSDYMTFETTPFLILDGMEYKKHYTNESPVDVITSEGEVMKLTKAVKLVEGFKDRASYTKLFLGGKKALGQLSASGIKVLCYIMVNSKPNQEEICLHPKIVANEMGYKDQRSIYEGLVDLLEMKLLGRKVGYKSCFWLNPNLFFNGDRTSLLSNPAREEFSNKLKKEFGKSGKEYANSAKD